MQHMHYRFRIAAVYCLQVIGMVRHFSSKDYRTSAKRQGLKLYHFSNLLYTQYGAALIVDEVQTGGGGTGKMW